MSNIAQELLNSKSDHSLIKTFNAKNVLLPKMYFLHPGGAGSEVYQSMADLLKPYYQSIGIDNCNIYYDDKIDNLSEIANYYMNQIMHTFPFSGDVHLCGWSLGGQIALEIAYLLEQRGFKKIQVCLLDTILNDNYLNRLRSAFNANESLIHLKEYLLKLNFDETYIKKVCGAHSHEVAICKNDISGMLCYTDILLFKATKIDDTHNIGQNLKTKEYILSINDNNVQRISLKKIKIKRLNCHHGNILKKSKAIINELLNNYACDIVSNEVEQPN